MQQILALTQSLSWPAFTKNKGIVLAILSAAGFSAKAIFVKLGFRYGASAEALLAMRMLIAMPFFLWMACISTNPSTLRKMARRDVAMIVILGLLGYYLTSLFDFIGLQYVSSGLERLTLFLYPTLVLAISTLWLGKRYPKSVWYAVALAYAGAGLAVAHDLGDSTFGPTVFRGLAWVGGSMVTYALYIAGSGEVIKRVGATPFAALATLVACVAVLLHFAITQPLTTLQMPWQGYAVCAAMALISTVFPVWALNQAIRNLGAGRAASISTFGPVVTIFLGWTVLGESISWMQVVGAMLVVTGVVIVCKSRK
ncbi:DMT family transporter [Paludibacterium yongneupense]|uniref:DMT family transporter n=1 Tax=Paludibacterium yongneupense TaxID=400061 RepID=UPI000429E65E|nr:DMT family transporter [Paludibacterium yongneupense]